EELAHACILSAGRIECSRPRTRSGCHIQHDSAGSDLRRRRGAAFPRGGPTVDRTLDRSLIAGMGVIAALLVATAALNYRNTRQLNEEAGRVACADEILALTTDVLLTVVDAETGVRGFLLSDGRDEFLKPYDTAVARLGQRLAALKDKVDGDPSLTA